jgi:hypothetical protein
VVVDLKGLTLTCIAVCPCTAHSEQWPSQDLLLQAAAGASTDRLSTGDDRQRRCPDCNKEKNPRRV